MTDLDHGADLRERFDRALTDVDSPHGLTAAALSDGRRLRRRRRALTIGTGVASAAAVTALVVAGLGDGAPSTGSELATQPAAPTPKATPTEGGLPSPGPADPSDPFPDLPSGWWDAPSSHLVTQLEAALPAGVTVVEHEPEGPGSVLATLAGPAGPGGFQTILYLPDLEEVPDSVTTTDAEGNESTTVWAQGPSNRSRVTCGKQTRYADTCEEIVDGDGSPVGRLTSFLQDDTVTFYEATLLGPDGGLVYLSVWNATDDKPGPDTPTSAAVPPLTLGQLRALVQDPAWTSYVP